MLLTLPYLWDSSNTVTKLAQLQDKVKHLMAGCCNKFDREINVDELRGYWRGKEFRTRTENEKTEILWEVSEMGFCLEVHALDCHASTASDDHSEAHKMEIAQCFPHGRTHPVCVNIGSANYGLGHLSWLERAPYLFSLRNIMNKWRGEQPEFLKSSNRSGYSEQDYLQLERQVAAYYVDTFFLYFGHAPSLPRQLNHRPDVPYESEICQRVLTA